MIIYSRKITISPINLEIAQNRTPYFHYFSITALTNLSFYIIYPQLSFHQFEFFTIFTCMDAFVHWLEAHQLPCYYKKFLGVECLGCGMQSAFILLLKGDFLESLKTYPALLPVMFMILFLFLHLIFKFKKGTRILKFSFIFTLTVMICSYVIHLINH